jgi:hypothetical protein
VKRVSTTERRRCTRRGRGAERCGEDSITLRSSTSTIVSVRARCGVLSCRGNIVFRDDGHLTATFSLAEAPALASRIDAAMDGLRRR